MTNQEAINELQSAIDLIKQDGKDWVDERDIPILEMAIKALEATSPCDLCTYNPPSRYGKPCSCCPALSMAIKALEAQEWIPVDKKSHPDTPIRVQVQLDNGWIITAYYDENEWFSVPDCGEPIEDRWIEAWRPLPEPYREENDDER